MRKVFFIFAAMIGSAAHGAPEKYNVDASHASVVFKINHMGFSNVYGMFGDVTGDFEVDDKKPEMTKVDITIKADSVDTKNAKRDEHLRKPDFFDAKQFPLITFKSESVKKISATKYQVKGLLTMHGVTKPLSFELTRFRTGLDPMKKQKTGGEASLKIKRSDYGMNFMVGPEKVGDEVDLWVSLEGEKT